MHKSYFCFCIITLSPMVNALSSNTQTVWRGFYLGTKAGTAIANTDLISSTTPGTLFNPTLAQTYNDVGDQNIQPTGFLAGATVGYNWQVRQWLIGLEADVQSLSINGETNTGAVLYPNNPSNQLVITSYANQNWLFTARPRLGIATPMGLFYGTGGLSLSYLQANFVFTDDLGHFESQRISKAKVGWVTGAGLEANLSQALSLKAEYLYNSYHRTNASNTNLAAPVGQSFLNQLKLNEQLISLGLNYHFHQEHWPRVNPAELFQSNHWETDVGTRLFMSSGMDGAPQPLLNTSPIGEILASRLIFGGLSALSGEVFARLEHETGLFMKGYLGAGSVTDGQLNDEDFPAINAYSNTLSDVMGNLAYATLDAGYAFLKNARGKVGAFIGYGYYTQNLNAHNCAQVAGDLVCVPSSTFGDLVALTEQDTYNALRLGITSTFHVTDRIFLTSETAYLPQVTFDGLDIHNARQLIGPEHSSHGDGAMLEGMINYQLNPTWTFGLGARYWTWNMHNGSVIFDFLGNSDLIAEPARFNTTRYGAFLQLNYHHDAVEKNPEMREAVSWSGLFVGGQLGGAWGKNAWSDPFGSTIATAGYINTAGFGDSVTTTGPLTGGNLAIQEHIGHWVYGIAGDLTASDIRGENTLFSGIGGINGQTRINTIGTMTGRLGTTLDQSLIFADAGAAVIHTKSTLNANTSGLRLGEASDAQNIWGWTVGLGVAYSLATHWTTGAEYQYIGILNEAPSFPSIDLIHGQPLHANQYLNLFKLNINYRWF